MKNDYDRNITLLCPTCASDQLSCRDEVETEDSLYFCTNCEGEFSYQEMKEANYERIEAAIEEMGAEIISDIQNAISKKF